MRVPDDKREDVIKRLRTYLNKPCDCSKPDWLVNGKVFELREFNDGNLVVGGSTSVIPVITVTCKNCGKIHLFNALTLGAVEKKEQDVQSS